MPRLLIQVNLIFCNQDSALLPKPGCSHRALSDQVVFLSNHDDMLSDRGVMTAIRVLKAVAVYALLVLATTAWVFKFSANGYTETLDSLRKSFGDAAYIFIVVFSVGTFVSTPIIGIAGIVGMAASIRLGRSALVWGFFCCILSFANFELLKNYGGAPTHSNGPSITPIEREAHPAQTRH